MACVFLFRRSAGQKTGAFLDQRENYLAAKRVAHGRALDCFTFNGGFALHIAKVCDSVMGIDISEDAIAARVAMQSSTRRRMLSFARPMFSMRSANSRPRVRNLTRSFSIRPRSRKTAPALSRPRVATKRSISAR